MPVGGLPEATIRALLYVGMARASVDERGFELVRRIRETHGAMPLAAFKAMVREQFNMLLIDSEAALAAIPAMLPPDAETRRKALELIDTVLRARGELSAEDRKRLDDVAKLFGIDGESGASPTPLRPIRRDPRARAS